METSGHADAGAVAAEDAALLHSLDAPLRVMARTASQRWRLTISERMAERCLEEYRAFKARADADLADYVPDIDNPDRD